MNWAELFEHEIVKDKNSGEMGQKREMSGHVQKILSHIQF